MPTLQCEFWNVGQGLFSSGRIQMGYAPDFHWVYCLQVPHHGSKHNWQPGLVSIFSPCLSVFLICQNSPIFKKKLKQLKKRWC